MNKDDYLKQLRELRDFLTSQVLEFKAGNITVDESEKQLNEMMDRHQRDMEN